MPPVWRKLFTSGSAGALGNLVQIVILVFAFRAWLAWHGVEATDLWLTIVALANFGALFDAGVSGAVIERCAALSGDQPKAWRLGGRRFLRRSAMLGLLSTTLATFVTLHHHENLRFLWTIAGMTGVAGSLLISTTYMAGILKAQMRFGRSSVLLASQQTALLLLPSCLPVGTPLLVHIVVAVVGLMIVAGLAYALTRFDDGTFDPALPVPTHLELLHQGAPYAAMNGAAYFFSHFLRLFVAHAGGPGDMAALAACQSMLGKAQGLIASMGESINPAIARGLVTPGIYARALMLSTAACAAGFPLLLILSWTVLPLWLPGQTGSDAARIMPILIIGYAAASASSVATHILNGMRRPWDSVACSYLGVVATLAILGLGLLQMWPCLTVASIAITAGYLVYSFTIISHGYRITRDLL